MKAVGRHSTANHSPTLEPNSQQSYIFFFIFFIFFFIFFIFFFIFSSSHVCVACKGVLENSNFCCILQDPSSQISDLRTQIPTPRSPVSDPQTPHLRSQLPGHPMYVCVHGCVEDPNFPCIFPNRQKPTSKNPMYVSMHGCAGNLNF